MSADTVDQAITKATTIVLEDWAMAFLGETPEKIDGESLPDPIEASVVFTGNSGIKGRLSVLTDSAMAETVCRSVLGMDSEEELDIVSKIDALKELVNVLGGHFLTEAFGAKLVFELSTPECHELVATDLSQISKNYQNWFTADDHFIGVKVDLNG